jgi:uncharacterized protein YndB with AHSA1/START domain
MILKVLLYLLATLVVLAIVITAIGYALPQNHVASVETVLAAAPARVFDRISDPARYPAWRTDVTRVEVLGTQPLKWREHGSDDPITYEVVESRPPERHVVRIADRDLPFGGTWTYELKPDGSGTRLVITEHGEVYNPIFRFMSRFVFSQTATMERFLASLKASHLTSPGDRR